ncbi:MAG TPA: hypothetical protein VNN80_04205 [Polyangiaceae bacterium]|nr:hypothetical protein [Polyangiaceae bacterium]
MTAPFRSGFIARPTALAAVAALLLAAGCSAPPGPSSGDDDVPEFGGAFQPPAPGTGGAPGGAATPSATAPVNNPVTPPPAGAAPSEQTGGSGIGLAPAASGSQSGGQNQGAGGAAMVPPGAGGAGNAPTEPANTAGAGGSPPAEQPPAEQPPNTPPPAEQPPVQLPNGLYFEDDFEGGRDPQWTESQIGNGGTFTLDTTVGANGSSSSIRIDSNNAFHTMLQFALPQAVRDADELFGRVFLRLAATPSAAHFIWVEVGNTTNDQHEMRLGHNVGQLQSNHFLNGEQDIRDQSRALVADTWYCLEFFMGNNPDELQVFLDDQETALSTTNYTAGPGAQGNGNPVADFIPPLEAFRIGWELQNGTVWFDDVALGSQRIGCN